MKICVTPDLEDGNYRAVDSDSGFIGVDSTVAGAIGRLFIGNSKSLGIEIDIKECDPLPTPADSVTPPCDICGTITERQGMGYKCPNCGANMGLG